MKTNPDNARRVVGGGVGNAAPRYSGRKLTFLDFGHPMPPGLSHTAYALSRRVQKALDKASELAGIYDQKSLSRYVAALRRWRKLRDALEAELSRPGMILGPVLYQERTEVRGPSEEFSPPGRAACADAGYPAEGANHLNRVVDVAAESGPGRGLPEAGGAR